MLLNVENLYSPENIELIHHTQQALKAQAMLAGGYGVAAEVYSAPSFQLLRNEALETEHPGVSFEQMFYPADQNAAFLAGLKRIVCVGEMPPVNFFAYPGKPSLLVPEGCTHHPLGEADTDSAATLAALADALGAMDEAAVWIAKCDDVDRGLVEAQQASPPPPQAGYPSTANSFNPAISVILQGSLNSYSQNPDDYDLPGFQLGGEAGLGQGLGDVAARERALEVFDALLDH